MLDNIFTEIIAMGVTLGITDKFKAILIFMTIAFFLNMIYHKVVKKHTPEKVSLFLFVVSAASLLLYISKGSEIKTVLYKTASLKVVEFKSNKEVYDATDTKIAFLIESNRDAYYYLHTEKADNGKMIPLAVGKDNQIESHKLKQIGYFTVKHFVGDERVILTLITKPYPKFEQKIDRVSYTKELEFLGGASEYVEADTTPMEIAQREILLKVKKDESFQQTEAGNAVKIVINTESSRYSVDEEINFDIETSREGYVTVFEATPLLNITRKKSNTTYNNQMRSFTKADRPLGKHIAIAIYTEENEHILATDFTVQSEDTKGGVEYSLVFHNGKRYVYDIVEYTIQP